MHKQLFRIPKKKKKKSSNDVNNIYKDKFKDREIKIYRLFLKYNGKLIGILTNFYIKNTVKFELNTYNRSTNE